MANNDQRFFEQLGLRIAIARKNAGFTQQSLADALEMKQTVIASYETGRRRMPISQLETFAKILGVTVNELLGLNSSTQKRGPSSKLQRQLQEASKLPRSEQKLISQLLDRFINEAISN